MHANGSAATNLTKSAGDDMMPQISPDGTQVAFCSNRVTGRMGVYVMNIDGTGQTQITSSAGDDLYPAWSPDGTRIAFTSTRDGNYEIYVMNADGSNQINLSNTPSIDEVPSWSPDGTRIAFMSQRSGGGSEIWVMNADGSNPVNLTPGNDNNGPVWSPDGTRIAFGSNRSGTGYEIYTMEPDGSNITRITYINGYSVFPDWSADQTKLVFSSGNSPFDLYTCNINGSKLTRLTSGAGNNYYPTFTKVNSRTLVGSGGDLIGSATGFLIGQTPGATKSAVVVSNSDFTAIMLKALNASESNGASLVFDIEGSSTAVNFSKSGFLYWNLEDGAPIKPFANYSGNLNGILVTFGAQSSDASAGKVTLVIPFTAPNRSVGKPTTTIRNGVQTLLGVFPAVFNGKGENIAPNGASEIRIESKTGRVLGIK